MASRTSGFYIPSSNTQDYVYNLKNESGELKYESQAADIGMEKQAAIQDLNKTYSDAITSAYSSYLNSKRGIAASSLGENYKQAYYESQRQALQSQLSETAQSAAEARQEIEASATSATEQLAQAYQTEVGYMDKTQRQLQQYYDYLKGLKLSEDNELATKGTSYLTDAQSNLSLQDAYGIIYSAQDVDKYETDTGAVGQSFLDWSYTNLGTSDQDYYTWLQQGGYQQYQAGTQEFVDAYRLKLKQQTAGTEERSDYLYENPEALDEVSEPDALSRYDETAEYQNNMTDYLNALDLSENDITKYTGKNTTQTLSEMQELSKKWANAHGVSYDLLKRYMDKQTDWSDELKQAILDAYGNKTHFSTYGSDLQKAFTSGYTKYLKQLAKTKHTTTD